ncbi:MAG: proton-conducting transporter membrane subunit [Gemmataceae bacterium]
MTRFSYAGMLAAESIRLAGFACMEPWPLVVILVISTLPPALELMRRKKPVRVYALHMTLFVCLLVFGWWLVDTHGSEKNSWVTVPLVLAILIRSGTVPTHCWITELAEHGAFGSTILLFAPLGGVYAAIRLALPVAPDWVLRSVGWVSVITAVYAACMATVQRDARRFFAYLFLSHAALVLVGLEFATSHGVGLTGALCLWYSIVFSIGGLGLTLRALEARFGRLTLTRFHGLYEHSRMLAVFFC